MRLTIAFTIDSVPFTRAVLAGEASLGGSESACVGLARALAARGHAVHIFTTDLAPDAIGPDQAGVLWHPISSLPSVTLFHAWDVLVALRMPQPLCAVAARFKVLWNQDLLTPGQMVQNVMGAAWAYDAVAYVSAYHRHQWEATLPELAPVGYVTRNGYDPALVPAAVTKTPHQIIHISRPERGLTPLLAMWPALRRQRPDATLALCRYSSMYDPMGWGEICKDYDRAVEQMHQAVGGIAYLGELGKPSLYRAIAESAVMWYPGVSTFAETSCIAAIEAQACGTPFVGSYKGALPETVPNGRLIHGAAEADPAYQEASIAAVVEALDGCAAGSFAYRRQQAEGRAHVARYTFAAIAAEWEAWLLEQFRSRYDREKPRILAQLLHEDDHVLAKVVAAELGDAETMAFCDRVIEGKEQTADDYAFHALNPLDEIAVGGTRLRTVVEKFAGVKTILDVACGSGAFALALAGADPERRVVAVDYADANIAAGREAAEALGVADRIEWVCAPVWDFETGAPSAWWQAFLAERAGTFTGLWVGEFVEHIGDCQTLIDTLEQALAPGGLAIYTCPMGPLIEYIPRDMRLQRGHVHHFRPDDLRGVFGRKADVHVGAMLWEQSPRGSVCGNWIIDYRAGTAPAGARPFERRVMLRPKASISAGIIADQTRDIRRCLETVWPVVDEIVIGDTGCPAGELDQLLREYPRKVRVVPTASVHALRGGFSEARNVTLDAATGDWFLWIDTDELLVGGGDLGKYLDGPVYTGYVIKQQHLHLDLPMGTDTPVRLLRRRPDIRFYGCIHEQPQMGDCNGEVTPTLQLNDVQIAHTGYLHEGVRRQKALSRNLPLLVKDQQVFPDRELGKLLVLRDYSNLALWERERAQGALSDKVKQYQTFVIGLFEARFMDPTHKYHALARPYYESALRDVDGAMEVEVAITGARGGLNGHRATPQRVWVRTPDHLRDLLTTRLDEMIAPLAHDGPRLDVEPLAADVEGTPV